VNALERRKGIVWIQPYGVIFPMRVGTKTNITCVQTQAGFAKMLGRKGLTQREMQIIFRNNRKDFETLASVLYEAEAGEALTVTVASASELEQFE
jgi:hypothetical protein